LDLCQQGPPAEPVANVTLAEAVTFHPPKSIVRGAPNVVAGALLKGTSWDANKRSLNSREISCKGTLQVEPVMHSKRKDVFCHKGTYGVQRG
jgi:hypothetical protein